MAVAALVLGILSVALNLIIGCIPIAGPVICTALGVIAIVLAAVGMKKNPEKKGFIIAGLVLGIVGVGWSLIALIACGIFAGLIGAAATSPFI